MGDVIGIGQQCVIGIGQQWLLVLKAFNGSRDAVNLETACVPDTDNKR